jgi:tRNA (guanine-N7-)-methyltransferase
LSEELKIKTYYESLDIAQSERIHYLKFSLNDDLALAKDEILKQLISESAVS